MEAEEVVEKGFGGDVIQTWLNRHHQLYTKATKHPFILSIRDGTIDISSFKRWLGQDYIFVREFIPFVASVLLKAWRESEDGSDIDIILGGMASLNDEISWFKKEGSKWDVLLSGISPQKTNQDYCKLRNFDLVMSILTGLLKFLESMMGSEVEYTVAMTAFWAIEAVYQESFSLCLQNNTKTPAELMETCQRWGNNGFRQYCESLQRIVSRRLENASEDILRKAEEAFVSVLDHEVGFWDMSYGEL